MIKQEKADTGNWIEKAAEALHYNTMDCIVTRSKQASTATFLKTAYLFYKVLYSPADGAEFLYISSGFSHPVFLLEVFHLIEYISQALCEILLPLCEPCQSPIMLPLQSCLTDKVILRHMREKKKKWNLLFI